MANSLQEFLTARFTSPALPRAAMMNALSGVTGLKQRAVAILDDARDTHLNETSAARRQQVPTLVNKWAAMVRQLEDVSRELTEMIQTTDEVIAEETRLKDAIVGGNL